MNMIGVSSQIICTLVFVFVACRDAVRQLIIHSILFDYIITCTGSDCNGPCVMLNALVLAGIVNDIVEPKVVTCG